MQLVNLVIISVLVLLLAFFVHELGHWAYFSHVCKKKVAFKFKKGIVVGCDKDYESLSNKQYMSMLVWGILFGGFIIFFIALIMVQVLILWMLLPYIACCISDIKNAFIAYKDYKQDLLVEVFDELKGFRRLFK